MEPSLPSLQPATRAGSSMNSNQHPSVCVVLLESNSTWRKGKQLVHTMRIIFPAPPPSHLHSPHHLLFPSSRRQCQGWVGVSWKQRAMEHRALGSGVLTTPKRAKVRSEGGRLSVASSLHFTHLGLPIHCPGPTLPPPHPISGRVRRWIWRAGLYVPEKSHGEIINAYLKVHTLGQRTP